MKYRLIAYYAVAYWGMCTVLNVSATGLSLSDAPMFVTEPLAPNIILSPVYKYDYNEVSLLDVPWAERQVCLGVDIPGISCPTEGSENAHDVIQSGPWGSVFTAINIYSGWRVTPWPDTCKVASPRIAGCNPGAGNVADNMLYTPTTLYPFDIFSSVTKLKNGTIVGGSVELDSLHYGYTFSNASGGITEFGNEVREDVYPEAGDIYVNDNNRGKLRYLRSDKNFLYFNKNLADSYGYRPWPSIGGYSFATYADATNAADAYYNPLKASAGRAALSTAGSHWSQVDTATGVPAMLLGHHIGQYWVHNKQDVHGAGAIWKSTSYAGTNWGGSGGLSAMTNADKINFAHWFTYWRSSYLATRGILANLLHELGPDRSDLLGKFRMGISHSRLDTGKVTSFIGYKSGGTYLDGVKSGTSTEIINALAPLIFDYDVTFSGWDYNNTAEIAPKTDNVDPLDYFGSRAAYLDNPSLAEHATTNPARSCRRNYEIILTPDYTGLRHDASPAISNVGNQDESLGAPYTDELSNQWADVGAHGWKTDLIDLPNTLLPGIRDSQTQQHVVRYVVGPRAPGHIFPGNVSGTTQADNLLKAQTATTWAASRAMLEGKALMQYTIDDLWHMVLNSRGYFFASDNVQDTVQHLLNAFNDVLVRNVSGSAVATNTTSLQQGGLVYQATVESDWKGHLKAYSITPVTTTVGGVSTTRLTLDYTTPVWDLAEKLSAQATGEGWNSTRKIITYNGTTGVPFRYANLSSAVKTALAANKPADMPVDTVQASFVPKLVEYLRGSGECEERASTHCDYANNATPPVSKSYTFRRRNLQSNEYGPYSSSNPNGRNVLGDIANSNPWLTTAPVAGLSDVDFPGYNQHRVAKANRGDVLYVGANDGMLHAVNPASTGSDKGKELFAYIPSFIQSNLYHLAVSNYAHKFYVDGAPFTAEASVDVIQPNGSTKPVWKTVLAGGANKGGKGYYLLDVTNPTTIAENVTSAASLVLWEFTHPHDLHYTYNLPVANANGQARQIARMNDGKWALIVGNGYPEVSGKKACLFIVYIASPGPGAIPLADTEGVDYPGTGYHKLCAGVADYSATGTNDGGLDTNGLSTPTPVDTNGDGNVDVIYAGDLNGNMWRFNVSSTTPANWAVEYSGVPLFVAKSDAIPATPATESTAAKPAIPAKRQPIITPPEVTPHVSGGVSGQLILFGTGKYLGSVDRNTDVQSFYGVWDRGLTGITRAQLLPQVLATEAAGATSRTQSSRPIPVYCTQTLLSGCGPDNDNSTIDDHLGWYWDMPTAGERLTGRVNLINSTVMFNTFIPSIDPCEYGGDGWLMAFNAVSGTMEQNPIFDMNNDGKIDSNDAASAGRRVGAALGGTTFARGLDGSKIGILSPTNLGTAATEGNKMTAVVNPGGVTTGRVSWYELMD